MSRKTVFIAVWIAIGAVAIALAVLGVRVSVEMKHRVPPPPACPDILVQRGGGIFEVYSSCDLNSPPLSFVDMDQYFAYLERQKHFAQPVPRVTIREERDICGRTHFREDLPYTRGIPNLASEHIDYVTRDPDARTYRPHTPPPRSTFRATDFPSSTEKATSVPFKPDTQEELTPASGEAEADGGADGSGDGDGNGDGELE